MLRTLPVVLLVSLAMDGGTGAVPPPTAVDAGPDAGTTGSPVGPSDAGPAAAPVGTAVGGSKPVVRKPVIAGGIRWPDEVRTLTTLDASAVVAANAALQQLLARFKEEGVLGSCGYSPKGLEVVIGEGGGMYIVRINQRMDKCGWVVPEGFSLEMDWFELYAVSPEGKVLARYPFAP